MLVPNSKYWMKRRRAIARKQAQQRGESLPLFAWGFQDGRRFVACGVTPSQEEAEAEAWGNQQVRPVSGSVPGRMFAVLTVDCPADFLPGHLLDAPADLSGSFRFAVSPATATDRLSALRRAVAENRERSPDSGQWSVPIEVGEPVDLAVDATVSLSDQAGVIRAETFWPVRVLRLSKGEAIQAIGLSAADMSAEVPELAAV